jgi:hypothetical protein
VSKNDTTAAANLTAEHNIHLEDPVSTKTFDDVFTKSNTHGTVAVAKPLITEKKPLKGEKDGVLIIEYRRLM